MQCRCITRLACLKIHGLLVLEYYFSNLICQFSVISISPFLYIHVSGDMIRKLLFTDVMTTQIDVNNKMLPNISKIVTKKTE